MLSAWKLSSSLILDEDLDGCSGTQRKILLFVWTLCFQRDKDER